MPGTLILCASPIGNLGDAPPRLREALEACDLVYAEDTRRSGTLLTALGVSKPIRSFFAGNEHEREDELVRNLEHGRVLALLTDAGVPGISDPGMVAVRAARRAGATVSIIPGPSAATAALAVSGFPSERYVFEGFLPRKGRDRKDRIGAMATETRTTVLFVSPHRLGADLADLEAALGVDRAVCVARELTKMHEEIWWGTLGEAVEEWDEVRARGEFTLVIEGSEPAVVGWESALEAAREAMQEGLSPSQAARQTATEWRLDRRELYRRLLES